jgi:DNA gyrase subunit B
MATTPKVTSQYQASEIKMLEGLEPVRKRPGMYIGSTDGRGLHHLAKEIMDNAVDEALAGFGKTIQLFHTPVEGAEAGVGAITVVDNGRGIPVDIHEKAGVSALEVVMTKLHAGGKFEETAYQASGGLHGVGAAAVNALSIQMCVVVKRNKKYYFQEYSVGKPKAAVKEVSEAEVKKLFPLQCQTLLKYETGTLVYFVPDKTIFSTVQFSNKTLIDIIRDRAYLMAGLYFEFHNAVGVETPEQTHFYFEGGIRSLVEHMNMGKKPLHPVVYTSGTWTDETTGKKIGVEVAMQYNDTYSERVDSYANVIKTPDGGAHLTGFRMGLNKVLKDYTVKNNLVKSEKEMFSTEDLKEGLTAVVFTKMPSNDIQFESQTKSKLNNSEAQSAVYAIFKEGFEVFLEENPKEARIIIDKVMLAARARLAARAAKDAVIRKGALEGSTLPGKLADCQSKNASESEIYIVEGDSAGGCFDGDTQVALADGRALSFKELLIEQSQGKEHFCYTIRHDGKIGIERILHPRITKQNAEVIKVTLDNGEAITCTPDHKFMLRDGTYKAAIELTVDDSLMPLNRRFSHIEEPGITIDGYEMTWDPRSEKWLFTHTLADWYNRWQRVYKKTDGDHCHHRDFHKLNNNPTNIIRLSKAEHFALHQKHVSKTLHRPEVIEKCRQLKKTAAFRQKMSQRMLEPNTHTMLSTQAKTQWQNPAYKQYMASKWKNFYSTNDQYRQKTLAQLQSAQLEYWNDPSHRQQQADRVKTYFQDHPEARKEAREKASVQWSDQSLRAWRSQTTHQQWTVNFRQKRAQALAKTYYNKTISALKKIELLHGNIDIEAYQAHRLQTRDTSLLRFDRFCQKYFAGDSATAFEAVHLYNHRVIKIEKLVERADVYDIEVPHTHNFALASGVFVHNSAKQGRDRRFQAIFPLRGKILNTERARLDKIVDFEELKNLVIALGAGIGETFNEGKLRYHRIILMNDADVDGEHITTLGLTFFFRHLPEVVHKGFLYIAMPPLYKLTLGKDVFYCYSEEEKDAKVAEIKAKKPDANIGLQRYKGLGEMNPEQLWETTMDPKTRILKRVTIEDLNRADKTFSTLMGDEVLPRKKFIQTHAKLAELDV